MLIKESKSKPPLPLHTATSKPLKRKRSNDSTGSSSDAGVKIIVRVKPPNKNEEAIVQKTSSDSLTILGEPFTFTFDSVADASSTQGDIFHLVGDPLVESCLAGFNNTVFVYGQTGSGKTYTMWGPRNALSEDDVSDQQGLTPRVLERLFSCILEEQNKHADKQLTYQCHCSFLEIYNEQVTDLLDPAKGNLHIREDIKSGVYVENLTKESVYSLKDVTRILKKGLSHRRTGATSMNMESSRSHCVFTCVVESRCKSMDGLSSSKTSKINLVDLAGSESQKLTEAAGERLKEAGNINLSLSQLGNVIRNLAEISESGKQRHIPYRDSKLTFLLQDSLGGNSKLSMICAISPTQSCKNETLMTLRFAMRAKAIKNKACNENNITMEKVFGAIEKVHAEMKAFCTKQDAENKKLMDMLTVMCENYSELQKQFADYMKKNPEPSDSSKKQILRGSSSSDHIEPETVYVHTDASDPDVLVNDGYKWESHGYKGIKGNPHPRYYFKCSYAPSCTVKRKVQRSVEDESMLVVIYEGEHNHPKQN